MIKTNKGLIECDGTGAELMADYAVITGTMFNLIAERTGKAFAKKKLKEEFEKALEEAYEDFDKTEEDLKHDIHYILKELLKAMEREGK